MLQIASHTCKPGQFKCTNGQCIAGNLACNKVDDCVDGSDEEGCPEETSSCDPKTQFDCLGDGKQCINVTKVCNRQSDCIGGEDESSELCKNSECCSDPIFVNWTSEIANHLL